MGLIKPTFKDWILDFQFRSIFFYKRYVCILLGMYIVAFSIGFLFWKSCRRRLGALDYIWKSGVGFTLFYFTNLFVEILGRKGSGTMIFIVSWCYGGLAMVVFILFWQGSYPPWWHHTGIINIEQCVWFCFHTTTRLKTDIIAKDQPGEKRQRAEKDVSKSRCWFPDIRSIVATKRFNCQYLHEASA